MENGRIPNRLKKYRRLAGFSQTQVAQFLALQNSSCVSKWEKGLALPGIIQLFKLCLLYKTVPNHLYSELWQIIKQEMVL
jgi:transcriptional regulator with XRE-family HTH domain